MIASYLGVRQGALSGYLLFIIYTHRMVQMIEGAVEEEGFSGLKHVLLIMDDTVVLAISRQKCVKKLSDVLDYCHDYEMEIDLFFRCCCKWC